MKNFYMLAPVLVLLGTGCQGKPSVQAAAVQAPAPAAPPSSPTPTPAAAAPAAAITPLPKNGIRLEAEKAALTGSDVLTKRAGFSGTGYVGSFEKDGAKAVWTVPNAQAGLYDVQLRYSAPNGEKGYDLMVNGAKFSGMLAATGDVWNSAPAGKVELKTGVNTLEIQRGWGYYDIDALTLTPAKTAALPRPPATLSDPQATPQAKALFAALVRNYGRSTLSGQYNKDDSDYVQTVAGKLPAIRGGDLIEYSPSRLAHGSDPKHETENLIAAAKAGQIVTLTWHWNAPTALIDATYTDKSGKSVAAPWWRGFYTDASHFDVQKALADPNSADYKLLLSDMDSIAVQLQKFSDAGVPVLWRPLHEAEGGWFWWGAKGPEPFKQLWRLMHDRMINTHHLHNLIWVDCSGTNSAWYPGDDMVDIIGIDQYPSDVADPLSSVWETLAQEYNGKKMLALTEFGGVPDVDKMRRYGVRWSYFVSWSGDLGPHKMTNADLIRIYHAPSVVTQDGISSVMQDHSKMQH